MVKYDLDEITRQRLIKGLSITELAGLSGLVYGTISDLEEGRTQKPHPGTIAKLAAVFGVKMETLVTKSGGV